MGVPESTPQLFGNSWKTLSACVPLVPGSLLDPCDVHLQAGEDWGPGGSWGGLGSGVEVNCFERGEMATRSEGAGQTHRSDRRRSHREGTEGDEGQAGGRLPVTSLSPILTSVLDTHPRSSQVSNQVPPCLLP